jgi:hypothetical protein
MPRVAKKKAPPPVSEDVAVMLDEKATGSVRSVKRNGPRQVMTIGSDHFGWTEGIPAHDLIEMRDAIVRVIPPSTATAGDIEALEHCLRQQGVAAVRVLPQEPGERSLAVLTERVVPVAMLGHRAVVNLMLDEVTATAIDDNKTLVDLVERVMTEEGL